MAVVEVRSMRKRFGAVSVVEDLTISVEQGEILALLGSSGCGKTTTLRCIAGLDEPTSGDIWINGVQVAGGRAPVPVEKRNVGMVFQSYAVWPHMTVFDNVAYGLKLKRRPRTQIRTAVEQTLKLVMLDGLADRYPGELSGGQQQRVALARSIVTEPSVLLLDEPLSNLDAKLREQMRTELRELIKRIGITAIHITHDQAEAMAVADRIAVMAGGRIEQVGSAREIYHRPASRFVAGFVGTANFVDATVLECDAERVQLSTAAGLPLECGPVDWARPGDAAIVSLRPESIGLLVDGDRRSVNAWPGRATRSQFLGPVVEYIVTVAGIDLHVSSTSDLPAERVVGVVMQPENVVVLPGDPATASTGLSTVGKAGRSATIGAPGGGASGPMQPDIARS